MKFCSFCGNQVKDTAKFCTSCGNSLIKKTDNTVNNQSNTIQPLQNSAFINAPVKHTPAPRQISADMSNCPFCGAALSSFSLSCPACGSEVRGRTVNTACRQLLEKLNEIEANKPRLRNSRINQDIKRRKEEVIQHFIIPNNKEDILEFLLLAQSNLPCSLSDFMYEPECYIEEDVWAKKYDEVYRRASLFLKDDPDFKIVNREREMIEKEIAEHQEKRRLEEEKRRLEEEKRQFEKENTISKKLVRKIKNSISEKLD
ncbi:MAG: zinc-ribbon domain-containing protein [Clostridia bacterium]|nr:zinc-ribbon domain-containing protein [Clostridia bacterium]